MWKSHLLFGTIPNFSIRGCRARISVVYISYLQLSVKGTINLSKCLTKIYLLIDKTSLNKPKASFKFYFLVYRRTFTHYLGVRKKNWKNESHFVTDIANRVSLVYFSQLFRSIWRGQYIQISDMVRATTKFISDKIYRTLWS